MAGVMPRRRAVLMLASCCALLSAVALAAPRFHVSDRVTVRERVRPDAEVCMVHFHGNEEPAREVMLAHAATACANVLWLEDTRRKVPWGDDRIPLPSSTAESRVCTVNPNRVLTPRAFEHRIDFDCDNDASARTALRDFLDHDLLPALARCRGGVNELPVVTYHNNSRLTVKDMDARASVSVPGRESDILLVTRREDHDRLSALGRFSVALQSAPPADDGSLSVLLQHARYINVEAQISPANRRTNEEMSEWALRAVGGWRCGASDWPVESSQPSPLAAP